MEAAERIDAGLSGTGRRAEAPASSRAEVACARLSAVLPRSPWSGPAEFTVAVALMPPALRRRVCGERRGARATVRSRPEHGAVKTDVWLVSAARRSPSPSPGMHDLIAAIAPLWGSHSDCASVPQWNASRQTSQPRRSATRPSRRMTQAEGGWASRVRPLETKRPHDFVRSQQARTMTEATGRRAFAASVAPGKLGAAKPLRPPHVHAPRRGATTTGQSRCWRVLFPPTSPHTSRHPLRAGGRPRSAAHPDT